MNDRPLCVVVAHNRYRLPGGEDAVFEADCQLLRAHGHRVVKFECSNAQLDGHPLRKALLPLTAVYNPASARRLEALLRREKPDIVHVHNTLSLLSPSVFWACRRAGVPVVHTLHNFRLLCPNGVFLRDGHPCEDCPQQSLWCAVRHRCYRQSALQSLVGASILAVNRRLGSWKQAGLIALTDFDKEKFLQYNKKFSLFDPARLWVRPNPVDVPDAPPLPLSQRQRRFVYVGRLEELKGLRTLLAAWDESLPPLTVVGDGPLAAWAKAHAAPNVQLAGRLPFAQVRALVGQSLCAVAPSLCYESFGLTVAEAHAVGTPVLGSDLGNIGGQIDPGFNGLRFAPGDPAALRAGAARLAALAPTLDAEAIWRAARAAYGEEENYRTLRWIYSQMLEEQP